MTKLNDGGRDLASSCEVYRECVLAIAGDEAGRGAPASRPGSVCRHLPVARSQMRPVSSEETDTARLASRVRATALTAAVWPASVCRHWPRSMSHTLRVQSWLLVTSSVPANATLVSGPVWPSMTSTQSPISMSHTRAVQSWEAASTRQQAARLSAA